MSSGQVEFHHRAAAAVQGAVGVDSGAAEAAADGAQDEGEMLEAHVHPRCGGVVGAGF